MSFTNDKEYNGYTNYPTWCANLWMDHNPEHYQELAQQIMNDAQEGQYITREQAAKRDLADQLKAEFEEQSIPDEASMLADLLNWTSSKINWFEIAGNMLEDVKPEDEEPLTEGDDCPDCGRELSADDEGVYCTANNCEFTEDFED